MAVSIECAVVLREIDMGRDDVGVLSNVVDSAVWEKSMIGSAIFFEERPELSTLSVERCNVRFDRIPLPLVPRLADRSGEWCNQQQRTEDPG